MTPRARLLVNAGLLVVVIVGVRAWQADGRRPLVSAERATSRASDGGALDPDQFVEAMREVLPAIKRCYGRLHEQDPRPPGRLVVCFTIVDEGSNTAKVSEASIVPEARTDAGPRRIAPLTERCMVNATGDSR